MTQFLAHGLGGRSDLPVPLWMALLGGAAAVLISFIVLIAFWSATHFEQARGRAIPAGLQRIVDSRGARAALRGLGIFVFLLTLAAAAFGGGSPGSNPSPWWLYVWFWVGLVPASLLLGPIWRAMNPLRAVTYVLARVSGDTKEEYVRGYPERLGYWPAAASLLVFVWLELVYDDPGDPSTVLFFLGSYSLVHILFAQRYGRKWYERGDGFEVYATLLAKLSPWGRDGGRIVVRNPLAGLATFRSAPGMVGVVCVLLGSTAFDGLTRTPFWDSLTEGQARAANMIIGSLGLLGAMAFVALSYGSVMAVTRRYGNHTTTGLAGRFAHSLVPIAIGYTIAHYFSLLAFEGQNGYILGSDPLGTGADYLGTGDRSINYAYISPAAIAIVQVAAIVVGHVVGVFAAHDRAIGVFDRRVQTVAQLPLLFLMVVYTTGGIALLVNS